MNRFGYTYCLVKYVHNPSAGEILNIGVLAFSNEIKQIVGRFDIHFERLSSTFANFDGDHYRAVIRNLEYSISRLNRNFEPSLFQKEIKEIKEIFMALVPDLGLSIQFGVILAGITNDLDYEVEQIYQRLVISQYPQKEKKSRSDEDVWAVFNKTLVKREITKHLQPKHFSSSDYDLKFSHTFKNDYFHILEPVTMDYAQASSMQERAIKILGQAELLEGNEELGTLNLLIGEPRNEAHRSSYIKAKNILNKISIKKEIVEERERESFAEELASYMKKHGVIEESHTVEEI